MNNREDRARLLLLSIVSLPVVWAIFQAYHLLFCKPIADRIISIFPQIVEHFQPPYPFIISLLNLVIWGAMAAIWPRLGFGRARKPDRYQSGVVLLLISISLVSPVLYMFSGWENPFRQMGFAIWTITPVEEEILFRGFLYALLLHIFHLSPESSWREVFPVLVLGAAWFSLWHLSPPAIVKYGWGIVGTQVVVTFFAGFMFNGLRHWTGSIWLVIPVHAAGNFMASAM